jgi:hypothetical protein
MKGLAALSLSALASKGLSKLVLNDLPEQQLVSGTAMQRLNLVERIQLAALTQVDLGGHRPGARLLLQGCNGQGLLPWTCLAASSRCQLSPWLMHPHTACNSL